jgi:hypothetical protein
MLTLWVDGADREALQNLCVTNGISVSSALRSWILTAIQQQTTELVAVIPETTPEASVTGGMEPLMLKELMQRMALLEKVMPTFDQHDMDAMKEEVMGGKFGSMRYRIGVLEAQLQSLGGSIAWTDDKKE